jgi:Sigma 54 modulation protein / S30EA ribosomal protein.
MRHNIEYKNFEPKERVRKLVEDLIERLDKYVKDFPEEAVFLRVLIEENAVRKLYHVSITLDLPRKILTTKEERHDVVKTVRDAFEEIKRQIKKYKAEAHGEKSWKRRTRREELRPEPVRDALEKEMREREAGNV